MNRNEIVSKIYQELGQNSFATYRLENHKNKPLYGGLYKRLFNILEKECIFTECYQEMSWFDGNDMIIVTSWGDCSDKLPKGIIRIN
jgi:hypothetical protein